MSKFLDKKEQVIDFKLTNYGHYLLSIGNFKPTYYTFVDDNVVYDSEHFGRTDEVQTIFTKESKRILNIWSLLCCLKKLARTIFQIQK